MTAPTGTGSDTGTTTANTAWHGPASLVAVVVGLLVESVALLAQQPSLYVLFGFPPVAGLVLLISPVTRQVGTGLIASAAAYPVALVVLLLVAVLG